MPPNNPYGTENMTPYAGGSVLVSFDLMAELSDTIDGMGRNISPILIKFTDEFREMRRKVIAKHSRDLLEMRRRMDEDT